jgi:hypothetical protein
MSEEVEEGEEDRGWLLYAEKAPERPFPVELHDGVEVRRVAGEALVGDDVLADVIAFRRTRPEEEAVLEG